MTRWLVLPRGINVGTRNRVPMGELRPLLGRAGFDDVATVLQSGNLIVTGPDDEPTVIFRVQELLRSAFDVDVPCLARSAAELRAAIEASPLGDFATDGSRHLVVFLSQAPSTDDAAAVQREDHRPEVIRVLGRDAFVWTPDGVKAMTLSPTDLERRFGVTATARNWTTVQRIAALL